MFDWDKWLEIFESLRRHKLRTFLTALSVWWGIFMLIILLGAGNGLENSAEHSFADEATNSLWMWGGRTSQEYQGLPPGRFIGFDNDDFISLVKEIPEIADLTGRLFMGGANQVRYKNKSLSFNIRGIHPAFQIVENVTVVDGRYINDQDVREGRKVCVIGQIVKESFFDKNESVIGKEVTINDIGFTIIGEFTDQWVNMGRNVYIPISTCQILNGSTDRIHNLIANLDVRNLKESQQVESKIRSVLARNHKFHANDEQAVYIGNNLEDFREMKTVLGVIKGFIWFVGIGSILAGVIGVSNIMLIIVKERTREIGIRKAMGATPRSIVGMILQESVFLTAVAGYVGLLSGFTIIYGLQTIMEQNDVELEFFRNPEVSFPLVMTALIILVVAGAIAGLFPALKAARINPVVAMKG